MKFLKSKWVKLCIVCVVLIGVILFSANPNSPIHFIYKGISVPLQPLQSFFSGVGNRFSKAADYFFHYDTIEQTYQQIEEENDQLKSERQDIEALQEENEELRTLLGMAAENADYDCIVANVIANDTEDWFTTFSIDKGSNAGIAISDCVVTSKGLVGKVVAVAPTSAKVMAIVQEESTLMGRLTKTNDLVRIRGMENLGMDILCKMDRVDETVDLAVGDQIQTTNSEELYPAGLVIGTVKELVEENNQRYALVEPAVDFRKLDKIMVMSKKEE